MVTIELDSMISSPLLRGKMNVRYNRMYDNVYDAIDDKESGAIGLLVNTTYVSDVSWASYLIGKYGSRYLIQCIRGYYRRRNIWGVHMVECLNKMAQGAAIEGHTDILNWLIEIGADDYHNIVICATIGGHLGIVKDITAKHYIPLDTIWFYSYHNGHIHITEWAMSLNDY